MEILSVALRNFKIHRDAYFEFRPGTNVISGENGAGKTSILEAIAWVLFDCEHEYTLSDLVRKGSTSAEASVTFISSADGETYQVSRVAQVSRTGNRTGSKYRVFQTQPQLQNLGLERTEDVLRWLRRHLGVGEEVHLSDLFINTVGIPQGTFTQDFLKNLKDRKKAFDPILKVEDYKQAYDFSSRLETYAREQVRDLEARLEKYTEILQDWEQLTQQQQALDRQIQQDEARLQEIHTQLQSWQGDIDQLNQTASQLQQQRQALETLTTQVRERGPIVRQQEIVVARAEAAADLCRKNRADYEAYRRIEQELQAMIASRKTKTTLEQELKNYERVANQRKIRLAELAFQLTSFEQEQTELEKFRLNIPKQEALEQEIAEVKSQIQNLERCAAEARKQQKLLAKRQADLVALEQVIQRVTGLRSVVEQIPLLTSQVSRYQEQLGRVGAAKQFEAELQQLVANSREKGSHYVAQVQAIVITLQQMQQSVPLLAAHIDDTLMTFQSGVALNEDIISQLETILADLATQVNAQVIEQQLAKVQQQLEQARRAELEFSTLGDKQQQQSQLRLELQQLSQELDQLQSQLSTQAELQRQQQQIAEEFHLLGNPREYCRQLELRLQQEPQIRAQYLKLVEEQEQLQYQLNEYTTQLIPFLDLDDRIHELEYQQRMHKQGYLLYEQNRNEANSLKGHQAVLQTTQTELAQLQEQQQQLQETYQNAASQFDIGALQRLTAMYREREQEKFKIDGRLPLQRQELQRLALELARRQQIAEERAQTATLLQEKQRLWQLIRDMRNAYKEAGPRVTRLFTQRISREADRIFRELIDRPDPILEWTEDYEIRLQEGGEWRNFRSLAGGEQMCAALAVRLALIRVLADIDIVFLDEPTTNMDEHRRRQLSRAVANIANFRQLFVISHDDTFESAADHIILIERQPAETPVSA